MHICTIVARNYVAAARVLARSFGSHNPAGTCWTLVIDDPGGEVDGAREPFEVIRPDQVAIEPWDRMAAGYSVLELSTAVKPWLLRYLLHKRGVERVTYLDPDIQVFGSLSEVDALLREHPLVVNPHLTAPMPRDGRKPSETDILISGSFNLGFAGFAAGEEIDALIDWWSERLATDCLIAPERGYFVDQRWMDFAPGLVPSLYVLRDAGYNVAYWNLASRELRRSSDGFTVNGEPLRFFHFSGYDPDKPNLLSKHQDRIELGSDSVTRGLCDGYARELAAEGHDDWRRKTYAWGCLPDGTPLDAAARSAYRDAVNTGALSDERIFTDVGCRAFIRYLRSPAPHGAERGVTRYLEALHRERSDLREAFPDLDGTDGARLAAWAHFASSGVPASLVAAEQSPAPTVNAAGYFSGVMGTGEHARQLVAALRTQGIRVATTTLHPEGSPEDAALIETDCDSAAAESAAYFNLLCANADSVPRVADQLGDQFFGDRYTISFWAWEVSKFPADFLGAFARVDEVWVGSRHVRDAVAEIATVPVLAIPQPVSLRTDAVTASPPPGLPDGFRFLFAFDYLSVFERKNPLATIEAFAQAFSGGPGASLIIKCLNDEYDPKAHERLRAAVARHPDVHLIAERLTRSERDGLMNAADCYVSLHRAEGFGYTMAEAMWLGKPVIATGYSGNLDYMTPFNSYLVDHRLVPIGPGREPYPADGLWAEPDVAHAARLMRQVFEDRDGAGAVGSIAAQDIRRTHATEVAGRAMADRLQLVLKSSPSLSRRRSGIGSGFVHAERVSDLIRSGPLPRRRQRLRVPQRAARKGLLRLLKPVTVHQRMVDDELLRAIESVDASLESLAVSHAAALRRIEKLKAELRELRNGGGERE